MDERNDIWKSIRSGEPAPGFERRVLDRIRSGRRRSRLVCYGSVGGALAALAAGLMLYFYLGPRTAPDREEPRVGWSGGEIDEASIEEESMEILFNGDMDDELVRNLDDEDEMI